MRTSNVFFATILATCLALSACGGEETGSGTAADAGASDAANLDSGGNNAATDSGLVTTDSGPEDSGTPSDMGSPDDMGAMSDAGEDAGAGDSGTDDAGLDDAGMDDAGMMSGTPLGDQCGLSGDCASGFCYTIGGIGGVCSNCEVDMDCPAGTTCDYGIGDAYARCVGMGMLGDACTAGSDCGSGFCAGGVCSECNVDVDCGDGGACDDQTASTGYFVCLAPFGSPCQNSVECGSGYCNQGQFFDTCAECEQDSDCAAGQTCGISIGQLYARCEGSLDIGDACTDDAGCQSGICNTTNGSGVCSDCRTDADCSGGGTCIDQSSMGGGFECGGGLGDSCGAAGDCASGYCYQQGPAAACSECSGNSDCAMGQMCRYSFLDGYASCM